MKKIYQTPITLVTTIAPLKPLANSLTMQSGEGKQVTDANSVLVKGNSGSSSSYNVWDEDWSK